MTDLHVDTRDRVRWLILDRPESRNGLTLPLVNALTEQLDVIAREDAVRVVVLSGAGGAFCSGLDLKTAGAAAASDTGEGMQRFQRLALALRRLLKPTLAAIDGAAAGFGADLAMGCDLRIASSAGRLGERFVRIGLMPDGGGTFYLPRLVGLGKAYELIYEGRMVEAEEALAIGLVNQVLPVEGFREAVHRYAARLAQGAPLAQARAKAALLASNGTLEAALKMEREGQLALLASEDFQEGIGAFLGKREPVFRGK